MRRGLIFLLSCGVIFGYGGAIASARWHAMHGGGCGEGRWGHGQYGERYHHGPWGHGYSEAGYDEDRFAPPAPAVQAPATAPQTVVVAPAAAAPAPAPQIFVIMPGVQGQPQAAVPAQIVVQQPQVTTPPAAPVH